MNRRAFDPRPWPLGYPVDKQIADLVVAQVPLGERLVNLPQAFPNLRHRRPCSFLVRLRLVHGEPRFDIAPELIAATRARLPMSGTYRETGLTRSAPYIAETRYNTVSRYR